MLGVWSGATNGFDFGWDIGLNPTGGPGYAAVYHVKGEEDWEGPTGFYSSDIRGGLAPDQGTTFAPIYVWADRQNPVETMYFSLEPGGPPLPPTDRRYILQLLAVPAGVVGAPEVGTSWTLPDELFTLALPGFATDDGLTGYQFSFAITPTIPEPSTIGPLAACLFLRRRVRRCRPAFS